MIVLIDYELGNIGSILNMIKKAGQTATYSKDHSDIDSADKIILAGVGSFDTGINNLTKNELIKILNQKVLIDHTPILGICLGMQIMTIGSEEGLLPGFGWIDGYTNKFRFDKNEMKIPHMGWNNVKIVQEGLLYKNMYENPRFYFVHSYYVTCNNEKEILTTTNYGIEFVSSFQKENIMGTQFHPEKSHKYGLRLIKNFIEMEI